MNNKINKNKNSFFELIKTLVIAVLLAFIFRSFFFQPFTIPSGSMKSTLLVGDYIFVSKYTYGYSKYSFPFDFNFIKGRFFKFSKPERGDIIVFRHPKRQEIYYIKRLIGVPGDQVQVKQGILYLNGKQVPRVQTVSFTDSDGKVIDRYIETLPGLDKISYNVLDELHGRGMLDNTDLFTVPEGHYFFMGDNRDNSLDSRDFVDGVGYIPAEYLVGKASLILFSSSKPYWQFWHWFDSVETSRLVKKL